MLVLALLLLLLCWLLVATTFYASALGVGMLALGQSLALARYVERTTREVTFFLEALRQSDFSQCWSRPPGDARFQALHDAMSDIALQFRSMRAERERQFHYLEQLIHHLNLALICFKGDGMVELANREARRLFGIRKLDRIEDLAPFSSELVSAFRTPHSDGASVVSMRRGTEVIQMAFRLTRFNLFSEPYTLISLQDIHHALEAKELAAWRALTRILKHEIMNSVAPISSLASTIERRLSNNAALQALAETDATMRDTQEALQIIIQRSKGLLHFVDSYHSLTQIPAPVLQPLAVAALFNRVLPLFRAQIEEHWIRIATGIEPPTLTLQADPHLIEQVLINLLLNALEAVQGQPNPEITLNARIDSFGHPVIQVIDNGPGLAPDVLPLIFIPFFTTKAQGSGIGLSLSRQIMHLHGGSLSLLSTPDQQTICTLRF